MHKQTPVWGYLNNTHAHVNTVHTYHVYSIIQVKPYYNNTYLTEYGKMLQCTGIDYKVLHEK